MIGPIRDETGPAHETQNDTNRTATQRHPNRFTPFRRLPPELRAAIYEVDIAPTVNVVRTLICNKFNGRLVITTKDFRGSRSGLWHASQETRAELRRLGVRLPASNMIYEGANIADVHLGLVMYPPIYRDIGARWVHRTTVFYIDHENLARLADAIHDGTIQPERLTWLKNLLVGNQTFMQFRDPNSPFHMLPSLRRIVVGFLYRWQDVALIEGPCGDIIEEVKAEPADDAVTVTASNEIHPSLEIQIVDTVRNSQMEVRGLKRAGIDVIWGFVKNGVLRKRQRL